MKTTQDLTINDIPDNGLTITRQLRPLFITKFSRVIYILSIIPEYLIRFLIWVISSMVYSIKHINIDNIQVQGPALLVANHVSYVYGLN
jgi:1-acyl-sn-glycerol-3-phosphate acyltransferase